MKRILATVMVGALALGMFATAEAEAKKRRVAEGIIIGIGIATLFGVAAAAANDDRSRVNYVYRDRIDPRGNAVAACAHRANRVVRRNGGDGIELRRVSNVSRVGSGSYRVDLQVNGYYEDDVDRHFVSCRVFRDRVVKFSLR